MRPNPPINLLGRVHVRHLAKRQRLVRQALGAVVIGMVLSVAAVAWQYQHLLELRERHDRETQALALRDQRAGQAASLQLSLQALAKREVSLQNLAQQQRAGAQALVELARQFPPGLRLTQWQQEADTLVVTGTANSGAGLAALMAAWSVPGLAWGAPELLSWATAPGSSMPVSAAASDASLDVVFSLRLTRQADAKP